MILFAETLLNETGSMLHEWVTGYRLGRIKNQGA
jgi:hypothetical protein